MDCFLGGVIEMKIKVSGESWLKAVEAAHGQLRQDMSLQAVARALDVALTELQHDWEEMK